ncbi:hypothetical protein KVR01_002433 [Diaporthe batatas]|uniref:uncharacterized protein n=1 Tax=Diaporthe batatas TaxID=748121 RepID=UPI001D05C1E1|nr:uncharacterized protein KVR01_002433 [Diaporthe batatas]KAG8166744.1 hypothetical protein KVR01_002433 [Diaporthe batatas]
MLGGVPTVSQPVSRMLAQLWVQLRVAGCPGCVTGGQVRRTADDLWIQLHAGLAGTHPVPSKPCRRKSGRVVEQHPHRRDDQYHLVGMYTLDRPWAAARHWLASLPLARGQGSEVTLQQKKGAARETSNIYHRGAITRAALAGWLAGWLAALEQNRAS